MWQQLARKNPSKQNKAILSIQSSIIPAFPTIEAKITYANI